MLSVRAHADVIDAYVWGEVAVGRVVGPVRRKTLPQLHMNHLSVVPMGHTLGKWCLITDISFLKDGSMNDGICLVRCSLWYITVKAVARAAQGLGRGTLLSKIDIKSAY